MAIGVPNHFHAMVGIILVGWKVGDFRRSTLSRAATVVGSTGTFLNEYRLIVEYYQ